MGQLTRFSSSNLHHAIITKMLTAPPCNRRLRRPQSPRALSLTTRPLSPSADPPSADGRFPTHSPMHPPRHRVQPSPATWRRRGRPSVDKNTFTSCTDSFVHFTSHREVCQVSLYSVWRSLQVVELQSRRSRAVLVWIFAPEFYQINIKCRFRSQQ